MLKLKFQNKIINQQQDAEPEKLLWYVECDKHSWRGADALAIFIIAPSLRMTCQKFCSAISEGNLMKHIFHPGAGRPFRFS